MTVIIFVQAKPHHSQDSETSGLGEEIESTATWKLWRLLITLVLQLEWMQLELHESYEDY